MTNGFLRHIVFPVIDAATGCLRHYQFISSLQWDKTRLREWQRLRLRNLVSHAYSTVPYYRKVFSENRISASDFSDLDDLNKLPTVTREELRSHFPHDTTSRAVARCRIRIAYTSGSTGSPFSFYDDKAVRGYVIASRLLFEAWMGLRLGDRTVKLTSWDLPKWRTQLLGEIRLSLRRLGDDSSAIVAKLRSMQPDSILANASIMSTLAYRIRVSGVDAQLPLKGIVTTGEVLLPSYREMIQQVFGCPVYDRYGLAEVSGYVAQECSFHQGLHVNGSISILEVIRDGHACGPGEAGKIVVTNLHNYAMPLIRYETGDTGTIGDECACGRAFSILAKIEGRSADWVATESYPVPIASFIGALEELRMRSIEKFQFNQTRAGELRLLVAPSSAITNGELYNLRQRMESVHPMVKVQVEAVDSIESTSGEKHERFKSVLGAKSR